VTLPTNSSANEDFFAVFRIRLTNVLVDARANIKQQTRTFQSTLDRFLTSAVAKKQKPATEEEETYLE
jgi:hypothetical protein